MDYNVTHTTKYSYTEPVSLCQNVAHLKPREWAGQWAGRSTLSIDPPPPVIEERPDFFGNPTTYFTVQQPHTELNITVTHKIKAYDDFPREPVESPPWESVRDKLPTDRRPDWLDAYQFAFDSRFVQCRTDLANYASESFTTGRMIHEAALDLTQRIFCDFRYDKRATTISTPVEEVFRTRQGVCQDFAHLQIACIRSLGLPARYISGYLSTMPPPGRPRLIGADATHAWISVFCGEAGWVDFDPTNNQIPGNRHVLLAWGRDYDDVSPVKGVILGGGQHLVTVSVDVVPE